MNCEDVEFECCFLVSIKRLCRVYVSTLLMEGRGVVSVFLGEFINTRKMDKFHVMTELPLP